MPHRAWLEFRETTKNIYFGVLVLAGMLFLVFASTTLGDIFGTSTWPVTFQVLGLVSGSFAAFMLIIIAFYAGELVWRERDNRLDQISDALPTPSWLPLVSKLIALMLVPAVLQATLMLCGMTIQALKGYTRFEPGLYLYQLFTIDLVDYWLVCALAIAIHSIVDNKYVGHFAMVVYYALLLFGGPLGLEHNLYRFGSVPAAVYSEMNGYGHFLPRLRASRPTGQRHRCSCSWLRNCSGRAAPRARGASDGRPRGSASPRQCSRWPEPRRSPSSPWAGSSSGTRTFSTTTKRATTARHGGPSTRSATRRSPPMRSRRSRR